MTDTPTVRLRRATPHDVTTLNALIQACYPSHTDWSDELHRLIEGTGSYVFCFDGADGRPLACVGVSFGELHAQNTAHIFPWVVTPSLQGKGVGRTLLDAIRTFASRHTRRGDTLALSLPTATHPHDFVPSTPSLKDKHGFELFISPL